MNHIDTLKLALEALETLMLERGSIYDKAITAIRKALAQPERPSVQGEPVAMFEDWYDSNSCGHCGMVGGHAKTCRHYTTPQPAVPDGWKLVPVEPTVFMQEQGSVSSDYDLSQNRAAKVWKSMLAAAPQGDSHEDPAL